MEALILTCGTGGGHNAAAQAAAEEFTRQGHRAAVLNPYTLCGPHTASVIDRAYISMVQHIPELFGLVYLLGELYRRLPFRSPVYSVNRRAAKPLADYLAAHSVDVIVATHLFPGEILTWLKRHGHPIPPVIYVATDYTCIPFTEELDCDAYVIPSPDLVDDFTRWGIPADRIYPLGIPVRAAFRSPVPQDEAKRALGLEQDKDYLLLSGGSIGAGTLSSIVKKLRRLCDSRTRLIVLCGNNQKLLEKLRRRYPDVLLLPSTGRVAEYICASRLYFTKPGGLSSTEAAVLAVPLVHMPPIPGCESRNLRFFSSRGMSHRLRASRQGLTRALALAGDPQARQDMSARQRASIPSAAAPGLCALAAQLAALRASPVA